MSRRPLTSRRPVIVSPAAVVVSPKSSAAVPVPTLATANVPLPAVRSVSSRRLPSAAIAAESLAGLAALSAVSTSPSVVAARQVDVERGAVGERDRQVVAGLQLDAVAVVQRARASCPHAARTRRHRWPWSRPR